MNVIKLNSMKISVPIWYYDLKKKFIIMKYDEII